jgi:hypothetical protein
MKGIRVVRDQEGPTEWRAGLWGILGNRNDMVLVYYGRAWPGPWTYRREATEVYKRLYEEMQRKQYSAKSKADMALLLDLVKERL